jgi:hypothetical protein
MPLSGIFVLKVGNQGPFVQNQRIMRLNLGGDQVLEGGTAAFMHEEFR